MHEVIARMGGARHPSHPLEACDLNRRYGATVALAGVDLLVRRGETVVLTGPNGSGKTTLLEVAAGLQRPDTGWVRVCGAPAGSLPARRDTVFVPGDARGFEELTVAEHAALLRSLYAAGVRAERRFEALLAAFRLEPRHDAPLGALSAGLRRRASLAAALALGTPLVLLDEATVALDPPSVLALEAAVRARSRVGLSTLLATQDPNFARAVGDLVVSLEDGVVVDAAPPLAACRSAVEEAFILDRSARAAAL